VGLQRAVGEHGVVAPPGDELALGEVKSADAAHDEPGGDVLVLASAGERGVGDLGDFGIADEALLSLVPDRVGIAARGPRVLLDSADRGVEVPVVPGGDGEPGPTSLTPCDDVVAVVGGVRAQDLPPLLGSIPLDTRLRTAGDAGVPLVLSHPDSPAAQALSSVAQALAGRPRGLAGVSLGLAPAGR
jgi:hypothetical protein